MKVCSRLDLNNKHTTYPRKKPISDRGSESTGTPLSLRMMSRARIPQRSAELSFNLFYF
jgi:hypothetical protein